MLLCWFHCKYVHVCQIVQYACVHEDWPHQDCVHPAAASQSSLGMLAGCSSMSKSKASTMRQRYDLSLPVRVGRTSINVAGRNNCGFKPRDCSNSSLAFRTSSLSSGGAIGHFTISTSLMLLVCVNPIRYMSACQQWFPHVFFLAAASCC